MGWDGVEFFSPGGRATTEVGRLCFDVAPGHCTGLVATEGYGQRGPQGLGVICRSADPQVQEHEQGGFCNGYLDEHKTEEGREHT